MNRGTGLFSLLLLLACTAAYSQCNFIIQHANSDNQCLYAIEEVVWQNLVNAAAVSPGNNITATGTNNEVFDAGGISVNTIKNNGWVSTVMDETNTERIFGLSSAPAATPAWGRAQFGIYFWSNGIFQIWESGNYRSGGDGTYAHDDEFKIAVENSKVKYYKNGTLFYTSATTPTLPLRVDVTLKRKNTATPVATIKQVTVSNGSDGTFTASASSVGTGASYQWMLNGSPVGSNSPSYTNASLTTGDQLSCQLTVGTAGCTASGTILTSNEITFTSQSATTFATYYALTNATSPSCLQSEERAVFLVLTNATATGNDVQKTGGTNGLNDASAFSANTIANNGYAETTIAEVPTNRAFGLSSTNTGTSYTTIQYAFFIRGDGTLDIYESGTFRQGNVAAYTTGTVLKIAVEDNDVKYYVNGTVEYVSAITPTLPLYLDLAFSTSGATLNDIVVVNGTTGSFTGSGSALGTSPVFEWKVNGVSTGVTTATFSSTSLANNDQLVCEVTPDLVGCTSVPAQVFDLSSTDFTGEFYITANSVTAACAETREEVTFTNVVNADVAGNDIVKFDDNQAESYNSGAVSFNTVDNNGYVEMTVTQIGTYKAFGLSATNSDPSKTSIQYGIEFRSDNLLHVFEGTTDRGAYTAFTTGDVVTIAIESNVVKYYLNNTILLYTSTTTPTLPLVVDVALYSRFPLARIDDIIVSNGSASAFTATSVDAGPSPIFQWKLNGTDVGTGASTYTNPLLTTGDVITCSMRPDIAGCSTSDFLSNAISMSTVAGASSPTTTWTGNVSSDWFNRSNWNNGIPKGYHKVNIPVTGTGFYPQIGTSSPQAAAYDLVVDNGAQLTITGSNSITLFDQLVNNGTFNANTSTVTLKTCTNNTNVVITSAAASFHNITIDNSNGVEVNGEFHITGQALFTNGKISYQNAGSLIIFDDDATVSGASATRYITGRVRKDGDDAFNFPVGNATLYRPVSISAPSGYDEFLVQFSASSAVSIGRTTEPSLAMISGCEYFSITHPNGAAAEIMIPWNSADCSSPSDYITDISFLRLARWNGTRWEDEGQNAISGTTASGTITSNSTTGSGYFTLASTSGVNILPVELADFKANASEMKVILDWKTVSEKNTNIFEIERADSSLQFAPIGSVTAAGHSDEALIYAYADELPNIGFNYYRLKMVDIDGRIEYSKIVVARYERGEQLMLFPNPARQGEVIRVSEKGRVIVLDPVKRTEIIDASGKGIIETADLKPGVYFAVDELNRYQRFVVY